MFTRIFLAIKKRAVAYYLVYMAPYTPELQFPLEDYTVNGDPFGKDCTFNETRWGMHLGEDCNIPVDTQVKATGCGRVVYCKEHPGKPDHPKWGTLIIIVHKNPDTKEVFYSVYGHLYLPQVAVGDHVQKGDVIGRIAPPTTAYNGWWDEAHLHLGIYVGPWNGNVLPGYFRKNQNLTRPEYWHNPSEFINSYRNKG